MVQKCRAVARPEHPKVLGIWCDHEPGFGAHLQVWKHVYPPTQLVYNTYVVKLFILHLCWSCNEMNQLSLLAHSMEVIETKLSAGKISCVYDVAPWFRRISLGIHQWDCPLLNVCKPGPQAEIKQWCRFFCLQELISSNKLPDLLINNKNCPTNRFTQTPKIRHRVWTLYFFVKIF